MPAFRFSLQPLLTLRKREEEAIARDVAQIERRRLDAERQIRESADLLADAETEMRSTLTAGAMSPARIRTHARASVAAKASVEAARIQARRIGEELERARKRLATAAAKRRSIELLRDRREKQWRDAIRKAEQREFDDHAVMRSTKAALPSEGIDGGAAA